MRIRINTTPEDNIINSTIKPIDEKDANSEIEAGEYVFNSDNMQLHKALGKRHSQGGTPVSLPQGSFIFSDFAKLALSKKDKEQMEFKEGGTAKSKNTPAKVLAREVDIKHHNKMIHILNSEKGDEIAKTSAKLMLQKNLEKIGQVAYKQEEKKKFKDDVPEFSKGTLPIYSNQLDDRMKKSEQYKEGGHIRYNPQFQKGGWTTEQRQKWLQQYAPLLPNYNNAYYNGVDMRKQSPIGTRIAEERPGFFGDWNTGINSTMGTNLNGALNRNNVKATQDYMATQFPEATNYLFNDVGAIRYNNKNPQRSPYTFQDQYFYHDAPQVVTLNTDDPSKLKEMGLIPKGKGYVFEDGREPTIFVPKKAGLTPTLDRATPITTPSTQIPTTLTPRNNYTPGNIPITQAVAAQAETDLPVVARYPKLGFTDLQKLNYLSDIGDVIKRYDPMRQHQESIIANPELQSAQPYLNQINQGYFNTASGLRGITNSNQLIAANDQLYGNRLDQENKIIGDVGNQNAQTINGWKQNVAQTLNGDANANRQFDSKYYDNSLLSRERFNNAKSIKKQNIKNNLNEDYAKLATAQSYYNTQPIIGTTETFVDKDGVRKRIGRLAIEPRKTFSSYIAEQTKNIDPKSFLKYNAGVAGQNEQSQIATYKLLNDIDNEIKSLSGDTSKEASDRMKGLVYYSESLRKRLSGK